jgi:GDP-4-dehydro-6-deoxy-D-mannose reductase
MTILVTGAFGFVGRHLINSLRLAFPASTRLVAAGSGDAAGVASGVETVSIDFTDAGAVDDLLASIRPAHVIHLAARSSVQQAHNAALATYETNVAGTLALAAAMRSHVPGSAMIFASTGEIYGRAFAGGEALSENAPVFPSNPYARSKLAAEIALQDMLADTCPVIVLRLLNHTGAGQDERFVVPSFAAQIARIEAGSAPPVVRVGNLSAERDFLDVADVVDAYMRALELADNAKGYQLFNVASGIPRSIDSILVGLRSLSRVPFAIEQDPERMRPSDIPRAVCDASAFRAATGWQPTRAWSATLVDVLDYWRDHCGPIADEKTVQARV